MSTGGAPLARVGFVGLGLMGVPMAAKLISAGFGVKVWNRTSDKAAPLLAMGAAWTESPAHLAAQVDVLILMLTNAAAVHDVLFTQAAANALAPGSLVVDMSSIAPAAAKAHAARLADMRIEALDAPVSGGTKGAEQGTLAIMVGGSQKVFERARPLLQTMGRPTHVGPVGAGQVAKLANQVIVGISLCAVSEALTLAARAGADPASVRVALAGGFADSRILQEHGARMLSGNFEPGGTVANQLKDLDAAMDVCRDSDLLLPVLELARQRFRELDERGGGQLDHSAVFSLLDQA